MEEKFEKLYGYTFEKLAISHFICFLNVNLTVQFFAMFASHKSYRISLPEPCHEKWQEMTPTEKGRFCASCQKEVIDFSQMNDAQLVDFLKQGQQGICGRFRETQLERKIEKQRNQFGLFHFKKIAATFLALISLKKGIAQGEPKFNVKPDSLSISPKQNQPVATTEQDGQAVVSGFVYDTDNKPLQNVEVEFAPYRIFAYTDSTGFFKMILDKKKLVDFTVIRFSYTEKSAVSRSVFKTNFPYEAHIVMRRSGKEYFDYGRTGGAPIFREEITPTMMEIIKEKLIPKKKKKHK